MNIIVIVSDTFRRDHLGCYGNKNIRTPNLDKFSQSCIKFNNCYATSFPTMPMRADLFTGKFTFTYLGWGPLPREETTLAEILRKAGYTTAAVVDTPFFVRKGYGYDRGFEDYVQIPGQESDHRTRINSERRYEEDFCAPKTMTTAEKRLEYYRNRKFFLYIDTWDPHEPWDPPPWYVESYYPSYDGRIVRPPYWEWRERGLAEEDVKIAHACYCGEISMVDHWVGHLLNKVKSLGRWDDTVILFTSDHGFYFGEHGYLGKTKENDARTFWARSPLYQEITRVPLLVYIPGVEPRETEAMVSLSDLMPTILELAQVESPKTVQAQSFVPVLKGEKDSFRDFVVTSVPLYNPGEVTKIVDDWERKIEEFQPSTITTQKWTLLYAAENCLTELYDILRDPNQSQNVLSENWEIAKDLHQKFIAFLEQVGTSEHNLVHRRRLSKA